MLRLVVIPYLSSCHKLKGFPIISFLCLPGSRVALIYDRFWFLLLSRVSLTRSILCQRSAVIDSTTCFANLKAIIAFAFVLELLPHIMPIVTLLKSESCVYYQNSLLSH